MPAEISSRWSWLVACTTTSSRAFTLAVPPMLALVSWLMTLTSTPGAMPTEPKPAAAATATCEKSLPAPTSTLWPAPAPLVSALTSAPAPMLAWVVVSTTFVAELTPMPTEPAPSETA